MSNSLIEKYIKSYHDLDEAAAMWERRAKSAQYRAEDCRNQQGQALVQIVKLAADRSGLDAEIVKTLAPAHILRHIEGE